jgi:hypothetical protein
MRRSRGLAGLPGPTAISGGIILHLEEQAKVKETKKCKAQSQVKPKGRLTLAYLIMEEFMF